MKYSKIKMKNEIILKGVTKIRNLKLIIILFFHVSSSYNNKCMNVQLEN